MIAHSRLVRSTEQPPRQARRAALSISTSPKEISGLGLPA